MLISKKGQFIARTGRYKIFTLVGSSLFIVGIGLITTYSETSNSGMKIGYLFLAGAGLGNCIQSRVIALQSAVDGPKMAIATSLLGFFQNLGG